MIAVLALILAAADGAPTLGVAQADASIEALNGKTVRVQGWLGTCAGYDCMIFPTAADENGFRNATIRRADRPAPVMPHYLSIGGDASFDRRALPLNHQYVTIVGRISTECRLPHGICTDRAPDLIPLAIERWAGPAR